MTTASKITPQTAPRDFETLQKLGVFQLRLLVDALGGMPTEETKMAYTKLTTDDKVNFTIKLLAEWDRAHGGAQNGVAPGTGAMPAPVMAMPVMQVDPAAVAAAAQAALPQVQTPARRTPRTETAAPPADLGVDVLTALTRIIQQNEESTAILSSGFAALGERVNDVAKANSQHAENYKMVYNVLLSVNTAINTFAFQSKLALALVLPLAEQVLGATRDDILRMALGDVDSITALIQQQGGQGKV